MCNKQKSPESDSCSESEEDEDDKMTRRRAAVRTRSASGPAPAGKPPSRPRRATPSRRWTTKRTDLLRMHYQHACGACDYMCTGHRTKTCTAHGITYLHPSREAPRIGTVDIPMTPAHEHGVKVQAHPHPAASKRWHGSQQAQRRALRSRRAAASCPGRSRARRAAAALVRPRAGAPPA